MDPKPTKQYGARLELPNHTTIEVVGDDLGLVKETVQQALKGGCRFEPGGDDSTLWIYHQSFDQGKTAVGWIANFVIPEYMSNKFTIEHRLQAA